MKPSSILVRFIQTAPIANAKLFFYNLMVFIYKKVKAMGCNLLLDEYAIAIDGSSKYTRRSPFSELQL